jgi:hypothetical protein
MFTHPLLEVGDFFVGQGIRLGNDGNEVDFGVQPTHEFNVNLLQTIHVDQSLPRQGTWKGGRLRVTSRLNEVETCVHAVVNDLNSIDTVFLLEIRIEARLDVLDDGFPAGSRVCELANASQQGGQRRLTCHHCSQSHQSQGCRRRLNEAERRSPRYLYVKQSG